MLNPSTADAEADDPTIRKCIGYAQREGFGSLEVVNLYAFRTTDPEVLKTSHFPQGPMNEAFWLQARQRCRKAIAAWGKHGDWLDVQRVMRTYPDMDCLHINGDGSPGHPLYLKKDAQFVPWCRGGKKVLLR